MAKHSDAREAALVREQGRAIRILLVDDHPAVRDGLYAMLAAEPDFEPLAAASSAREALELRERGCADVALLDYHLPDEDGIQLCLRMRDWQDPPRAVIYSAFADHTLGILAVVAGASALVSKSAAPEELCDAIRATARGKALLTPPASETIEALGSRLDPEDIPILGMLLHGTEPAEIAETLGVSESWLVTRRWGMIKRLTGAPSRRSRPPHGSLGQTTSTRQEAPGHSWLESRRDRRSDRLP